MSAKQRLSKLEADERRALLRQLHELETCLSNRITERERFIATICLTMCDPEAKTAWHSQDGAFAGLLAQRNAMATLQSLREQIEALQWATEELSHYDSEPRKLD